PSVVSGFAKRSKLFRLMFANGFVDQKDIDRRFPAHDELIHAADDLCLSLDRALVLIGCIVDLALRESSLDSGNHAAERIELVEILPATPLHVQSYPLDEVRSGQRIDRIRHAGSVRED